MKKTRYFILIEWYFIYPPPLFFRYKSAKLRFLKWALLLSRVLSITCYLLTCLFSLNNKVVNWILKIRHVYLCTHIFNSYHIRIKNINEHFDLNIFYYSIPFFFYWALTIENTRGSFSKIRFNIINNSYNLISTSMCPPKNVNI